MITTTRARNRVSHPAPVQPTPPLPATPVEREAALADAVFAALLALQQQLSHPDAAVVREAAAMILDFEKTRLRHGRNVVGTVEMFAASETSGTSNPARFTRGEEPEVADDELDPEYVEQVRRDLEGMKGTNGIPEVITRAFAEEVARHAAELRRGNAQCPPVIAGRHFG